MTSMWGRGREWFYHLEASSIPVLASSLFFKSFLRKLLLMETFPYHSSLNSIPPSLLYISCSPFLSFFKNFFYHLPVINLFYKLHLSIYSCLHFSHYFSAQSRAWNIVGGQRMFNGGEEKVRYMKVYCIQYTFVLVITLCGRQSRYYFLYFPNKDNCMSCPRSQTQLSVRD